MEPLGYTDRLSVAPGGDVAVMVSASRRFEARLLRLIHGDPHPDGPGYKAIPVSSAIEGTYPGVVQPLVRGSHLEVDQLPLPDELTLAAWIWPTSLGPGERALLGHRDGGERALAMTLDEEGRVALRIGARELARTAATARLRTWSLALASVGPGGEVSVGLGSIDGPLGLTAVVSPFALGRDGLDHRAFAVAACAGREHFNGKVEEPVIFARALSGAEYAALHAGTSSPDELGSVLARWDFAADPSSRQVRDVTGHGHGGRLVNMPTRAVTGRRWRGTEADFRLVPEQYAAVHFHDDDLDDADWDPSFTWTVPDDLPSGVYGIELGSGESKDVLPLFVTPPRGKATAPIALLIPTFSYLAYANEHMLNGPLAGDDDELPHLTSDYPSEPEDVTIVAEQLHSLYDHHSDGSGVCYASWLRPLPSVRPRYHKPDLSLGAGAAHQLGADLHLVDWLYERGEAVDVVTDVDLHAAGPELLEGYRVVLTGSHPEYVSERILDSLTTYARGGGRIMYLGGNGFYWVTELDPEEGHTIEVRRWGAATRIWDAEPGEWHLGSSGSLGGLWRYRGRAPQRLFGVGFTAHGSGDGRPYRRTPESYDERFRFAFEGLGERTVIADQAALVNFRGAAGVEVDRFDTELGSPEGTVILATAAGFGDQYQHAVDEVLISDSRQAGSISPLVRADMVLTPHPNGGAVFSPGSISWCSCLGVNGYDNDVSRITANVLRRFLADQPVI